MGHTKIRPPVLGVIMMQKIRNTERERERCDILEIAWSQGELTQN